MTDRRPICFGGVSGRVGALVDATPQECRLFSDPVGIIRRHAGLPAPGMPGPFSLGQPGAIEALFEKAWLQQVRTEKIDAPVLLESARECLWFEQESFGALHQMLSALDDDAKATAWKDGRTNFWYKRAIYHPLTQPACHSGFNAKSPDLACRQICN